MKYMKEITEWTEAPSTPNHTYIMNDKNECVGYIATGTRERRMFSKPSRQFSKSRRKFIELKGRV